MDSVSLGMSNFYLISCRCSFYPWCNRLFFSSSSSRPETISASRNDHNEDSVTPVVDGCNYLGSLDRVQLSSGRSTPRELLSLREHVIRIGFCCFIGNGEEAGHAINHGDRFESINGSIRSVAVCFLKCLRTREKAREVNFISTIYEYY